MGSKQAHEHLKLLEKVEEAYVNESKEDTEEEKKKHKSSKFLALTKKLWQQLEHEVDKTGTTQGYLNEKQAKRFFEESYDYFQKLLQDHGTYFNPSIPKEQIISEWIAAFDLDKDNKLSFDEFVHVLQAMTQANHPEIDAKVGENPILQETFTYDFFVPPHLKKFTHEENKNKGLLNKENLPIELTGIGVEIVVDGLEDSGVKTLIQMYAGPLNPDNYAQCKRDILNRGIPIPMKVYLHPDRSNFHKDDYLPVTKDYPFRFHLIILVFDLIKPVTDELKVALATRVSVIKKYLDHTYDNVAHPPLLFVGNKMDEVQNLTQSKKALIALAEKHNALCTFVSAKTGLFVSKSFREALNVAIAIRFGYVVQ